MRGAAAWAAAAGLTLAALGGCAALPPPPHHGYRGGLAAFWTRRRLLGARPFPLLRRHRGVPSPGQSVSAHPALRSIHVGALFVSAGSADHFCTASVVASRGHDLLITAAHCLSPGNGGGYRRDIAFIPDYRDGQEPFGIWTPARLLVAPGWARSADPSLDVGFVVLRPRDGRSIQDVLGANRLGAVSGYRYLVRVTGYPDSGSGPIACRNWTSRQSASQLRFACGGFTGGTSGSPWVTGYDPLTGSGTIVGVIGGYQQGGDTAAVSYSPVLGSAIQALYRQAEAAGTAPGA